MSVAIDANLLLYASDSDSRFNEPAVAALRQTAEAGEILYLFWPVAMAYLRVATHPAIFRQPLTPAQATANLTMLLERPNVRSPGEDDGFWQIYKSVAKGTVIRGNLVPDAHLVALMRQYGVRTLLSHDRDFQKFEGVQVRDPFH